MANVRLSKAGKLRMRTGNIRAAGVYDGNDLVAVQSILRVGIRPI